MCGTCETDHTRRWTGTRLTVLAFVAALLVLSTAGLIARVRASDTRALGACTAASTAAVRFQSAVTRDLRHHTRLHADTNGFARELRSLGATGCPETLRFLRAAEETLGSLCEDCVVELRGAGPAAA